MPWVEVEERHEEVESYGRAGADDEVGEDIVTKVEGCSWAFELGNDNIDGCEDCVGHYNGVYDKARHEHFLGSDGCQHGGMKNAQKDPNP